MATTITDRLGAPVSSPDVTDLSAMEALTGTGVAERTGTNTWVLRSITGANDALAPVTADALSLGTDALPWSDLFFAAGGVINWDNGDVTVTHTANTLTLAGATSGYVFDATIKPSANDGAALGAPSAAFSDLFVASDGVIDFDSGDVTLTHSASLLTLAGGDLTIGASGVLSAGSIELGHASDTTLTRSAAGRLAVENKEIPYRSEVRERLTTNRIYYVDATNGDDGNDGLSAGVGGAFSTIQKAVDTIEGVDPAGYDITIQLADDTYSEAVVLKNVIGFAAAGGLIIKGNSSTPGNVVVSNNGMCFTSIGLSVTWDIKDMKVTSSGNDCLAAEDGGTIRFDNLVFGTASATHMSARRGGAIVCLGDYEIDGGAARHMLAEDSANLRVQPVTVTLTGTPAFSDAFVVASDNGVVRTVGNTYSGAATGKRYQVIRGAVLITGSGPTYFPGNAAGTGTDFSASPWGLYA